MYIYFYDQIVPHALEHEVLTGPVASATKIGFGRRYTFAHGEMLVK